MSDTTQPDTSPRVSNVSEPQLSQESLIRRVSIMILALTAYLFHSVFVVGISEIVNRAKEYRDELIKQVYAKIDETKLLLEQRIKELAESVTVYLQPVLSKLHNLREYVEQTVTKTKEFVLDVLLFIPRKIEKAITYVKETLNNIKKKLDDLFNLAVAYIVERWNGIKRQVADLLTGTLQNVKHMIQSQLDKLRSALHLYFDETLQEIHYHVEVCLNHFRVLVSPITDFLLSIRTTFYTQIENIKAKIIGALVSIQEKYNSAKSYYFKLVTDFLKAKYDYLRSIQVLFQAEYNKYFTEITAYFSTLSVKLHQYLSTQVTLVKAKALGLIELAKQNSLVQRCIHTFNTLVEQTIHYLERAIGFYAYLLKIVKCRYTLIMDLLNPYIVLGKEYYANILSLATSVKSYIDNLKALMITKLNHLVQFANIIKAKIQAVVNEIHSSINSYYALLKDKAVNWIESAEARRAMLYKEGQRVWDATIKDISITLKNEKIRPFVPSSAITFLAELAPTN